MTTRIEAAYIALRAVLQATAKASDACPDTVQRNCSVQDLIAVNRGGVAAYLNLLDAKGRIIGQEVSGIDDLQAIEMEQPAILEIVVVNADDVARDAQFDAIMAALKDCFQTLDPTLGGVIDNLDIPEPPDRMVLRGDAGVKAASVRILMTLTAPTVFG